MKSKPVKYLLFLILIFDFVFINQIYARRIKKEVSEEYDIYLASQIFNYVLNTAEIMQKVTFQKDQEEFIPIIMLEYFKQQAALSNMNLEEYYKNLVNDPKEVDKIASNIFDGYVSFITADTATGLFRFRVGVVRDYFDQLIEQKVANNDFSITVLSVGSSYGYEALSIAMVLYDRMQNYAKAHISEDENTVKDWIKGWNINFRLFDKNFTVLKEAKDFLAGERRLPLRIKIWGKNEDPKVLAYRDALISRYIINVEEYEQNGKKGEIGDIAPEILSSFRFTVEYLNLFDDEQIQRLIEIPYEVAFHANVLKNNPIYEVEELLEQNLNPDYIGLGCWGTTNIRTYQIRVNGPES